jgi:hypothetical protein
MKGRGRGRGRERGLRRGLGRGLGEGRGRGLGRGRGCGRGLGRGRGRELGRGSGKMDASSQTLKLEPSHLDHKQEFQSYLRMDASHFFKLHDKNLDGYISKTVCANFLE